MTANPPNTPFRLGENDSLYGAERASGVPYLDYHHYVTKGRQLQGRAMATAMPGLFRWAILGARTKQN
jgi:hypothetical protein